MCAGVLGVGRAPPTPSSQPAAGVVVAIGDVMKGYLERVPVSVSVRVDKAEIGAQLDKRTKYVCIVWSHDLLSFLKTL